MAKFVLILATLLPTIVFSQTGNKLTDKLQFGSYTAGYKLITAYDKSRAPMQEQQSGDGRIVPIYFWYPSSEAASTSMTLKDYFSDLAYSLGEEIEPSEVESKAKEVYARYHFDIPDSILQSYMAIDINTLAGRDLPIAKGKFPVVTFSHGHVDRWWIWGEYLASHGIAVVGTPNAGTLRKRHEMGLSGLETQIRDAQFAVSEVSENESIDQQSVVAVGSSYGSLTAAGFATRDNRVKGVISLDGIIADVNEGELLTMTPYFDYKRFATPILHLHSGFNWSSNYTIMDRLTYSDQYRIHMNNLRHSDYHFEGMADLFGTNFRGRELADNSNGFVTLTRYVLAFIQGVTIDKSKLELLTERLPEVKEINFVAGAESQALSASELLTIVRNEGFERVTVIYEQRKVSLEQPFSAETFYEVGLTLHRYGMLAEQIRWFEFYKEAYPNSADAHYRLARLTALDGNPELGAELLKQTIEVVNTDPSISVDRRNYLLSRIEFFLNR